MATVMFRDKRVILASYSLCEGDCSIAIIPIVADVRLVSNISTARTKVNRKSRDITSEKKSSRITR